MLDPAGNSSSLRTIMICSTLPPNVNSKGVGSMKYSMVEFSLPLLHFQMLFIFAVTQAIHFLLKRFGQPKIVSQLLAGLILGPSFLGRIKVPYTDDDTAMGLGRLFPIDDQENIIAELSLFGYTLFMFLIGVKMDVGMITKTGKKALATGIVGLVTPLLVSSFCTQFLVKYLTEEGKSTDYFTYLAATHSLTAFPVICSLLIELKLLNSELGRLALSSTIISEILSVSLLSIGTLARDAKQLSIPVAAINISSTIFFILGAVFFFRPAMFWVIRQTPEGRPVQEGYIFCIILAVLASGFVTNTFGQYVIFGPYILGLVVPDGPPLGSTLVDKFDSLVSGLLVPIFVTTCTLRTDFSTIDFDSNQVWINSILLLITSTVKIIATMLPALFCKVPLYDALTVSLIMNCKGIVEMATYSLFRDSEIINQETFALLSISTLLAASIVPTLVQILYDPSRKYAVYQRRTIMHRSAESELRVLACILNADTIAPMINLLDASCPTRESPMAIYVLHLIQLVGRSAPLLISHQIQKRIVSNQSYSENVILAFNNFEKNYPGALSVQAFTAISPPNLMHEDVCTLALKKLTSLIIVPFHLKWDIDGSIASEDRNMRIVINSVLSRAPCSVAILVDRGYLGQSASTVSLQSTYCVAMLFFGGNDDREALCYAKCMARDPAVRLTVVHFIAVEDEASSEYEKMLDSQVLKDVKFKGSINNRHVIYMEEMVQDGPQTALIVRTMVDEYDLIIVGRRHNVESQQTSGLAEWCLYSELGVVGDLLASSDLDSKTSVLVVQQQQQLSK